MLTSPRPTPAWSPPSSRRSLVILYAVFVGCACIHVSHGFWSMFQSLGWVRSATRKPLVLLSGLVGLVIFVMFMAPPVAIVTGLIH